MIVPPRHQETGILRDVWREFNRLRDYAASLRPVPGKNIHVKHTSQGVVLTANPATEAEESAPGEIAQFVIKSMDADHLVCNRLDGTDLDSTDEKVVKPFHLRRTPFDNRTYDLTVNNVTSGNPGSVTTATQSVSFVYLSNTARKASVGSVLEYQVIIPYYNPGDLIYASKAADILAPRYGGAFTDTELEDTWLDLNLDGRAWARHQPSA